MCVIRIQNINLFTFKAKPENYAKIDNYVSRSAQPQKEDFKWLKEQDVTDVINFRTMVVEGVDFSEEEEVLNITPQDLFKINHLQPQEDLVEEIISSIKNIKDREKVEIIYKIIKSFE